MGTPIAAQVPVISTLTGIPIPENTPSYVITASNSPTSWNIVGGDDQNKFTINASGLLSFKNPPDFEKPSDVFANNTYKVQLTASNASGPSLPKQITFTVANVNEHPDPPSYLYVIAQDKSNTLNWTASTLGGVNSYEIFRSQDSLTWLPLTTVSSVTTSYTDNALVNGRFYFYKVRADSAGIKSSFSNIDGSTPYNTPITNYMHFDGSGDYMVVNDTCKLMSFPYLSSSTIECWVRFNSLPAGKTTIISKDYNGNSSLGAPFIFHEIYYSAGKFIYQNNGGTLTSPVTNIKTDSSSASLVIKANTWYHIAAVYSFRAGGTNDDSLKLYINGEKQKTVLGNTANTMETSVAGMNLNFPLNSRLIMGATTSAVSPVTYSNFLDGDISEVRLWTTELTQSQIQANMNTRRNGNEAGMIGLWHLDTLRNMQVYDYQKLNFNAIVYGNVCHISTKKIAVDDFVRIPENSVNNYINVRKNDTISGLKTNVLTKIIPGYPKYGSALNPTVVINKDSINYSPAPGFIGIDTIKYLICDTTFFYTPYQYADTAVVIINVRCNTRSGFDWNTVTNGEDPTVKTYIADGLFVKFKLKDQYNITNEFNVDNRFQGTRSVVWQQSPGSSPEMSTTTISFNVPVNQICFNFLNVDYSGNNKDSLIIDPYYAGNKIVLNAGAYTLSPAVTFKGNNTFIGKASVDNPSVDGNIEVCFLPVIDSIKISYGNSSNPVGNNQSIGIGNFDWCEIQNHAPVFINNSGAHIATLRDTSFEDKPDTVHLKFSDVDMDMVTILQVTAKHGTILGISMADSTFRYQADLNYNGNDTIKAIIQDDRSPKMYDTLNIYMYVRPINDAPSFTKGANQTILEDAGVQSVSGWATSISKGPANESSQTLTFTVTNNNTSLFSAQPAIDASGNLTYTPTANANGSATVDVVLKDNGEKTNGGIDSTAHQTFTITITSVNDSPSFTAGDNQSVNEDASAQSVTPWATAISKGPANESSQTLTFTVTNNNNSLFSSQPFINASGNLTYTPAANANGTAIVNAVLKDNGGELDSTSHITFTITVNAVNDPPSFTAGGNQSVNEDAGAQSFTFWASGISKGPANESSQTLTFSVTNNNTSLFSAQPSIDVNGNLTYTPATNENGMATVDVVLKDNGGNASGGVDSTSHITFTITVNTVNNPPSFTAGGNQSVNEDAGAQSVTPWATGISKGPANESSQTLTFTVTNNNTSLFSTQPTIDASGNLTYTPATNAHGFATVDVVLKDDGGTANGGVDSTSHITFTISVITVNNPPSFTAGGNISVNDDAGAQSVNPWATGISEGPADESIQTLTFIVTNNNTGLFSAQPAIDASGNLTYTPATNAHGMATVDVVLKDNGGIANGGVDSSAHQTFIITVNDNQNPTITAPANITVNTDIGLCTATSVAIGTPITADNCGVATVTNDTPASFTIGTTIVTWTVTDVNGNKSVATQSVTVNDNQMPTITPPENLTVNTDLGIHTASGVIIGTPITADNCGVATVTNDAPAIFPAGITTVTWTVTDINGNITTATQTVTVIDNAPPTITSPAIINVAENIIAVMTVTATDPDIDNILKFIISGGADAANFTIDTITGVMTFIASPDYEIPNDLDVDNTYIVEVTVTDNYGLTDRRTISVTVTDVNETPTNINLSNSNVYENQPIGTVISTFTTIDQDTHDTHTYEILPGNDAASFVISNDTLKTAAIFNYTVTPTYTITIRTIDQGGLFFDKIFIITVNNINEAPQILDNNNIQADTLYFDAYDNETLPVCLNVFDPDNDNTSITDLRLIDGKVKLINSSNTCLSYLPPSSFLGQAIFFVKVCDNGTPSLCDSVIMIINVHPRFFIPQAISPNEDEIDDTWFIQGLERYPDNTVIVFSRWGDIVYKCKGYDNINNIWKGEYGAGQKSKSLVPDGTYFYIIEIEGMIKPLSGYLVVKR